jgi:hypothetical protein
MLTRQEIILSSAQDPPRFTVLSNLLAAMVGIYLISNIAFITGCVSASRTTGANSCNISDTVQSLVAAIPAIKRLVFFLEQQGSHQRAELVGSVYSFAWASAIATALAMILTGFATAALLGDESKRAFKQAFEKNRRRWIPPNQRSPVGKASALMVLVAIVLLWEVYFGDFEFRVWNAWSHGRTVYVGDADLYRSSILLAVLLFFLMLPVLLCVRTFVLKSAGDQAASSPPRLSA